MKEILLTQGKVAFVDDKDFEPLNAFKWYAMKRGNSQKFHASIGKNGKTVNLGLFETASQAREAYLKAKKKYHVI